MAAREALTGSENIKEKIMLYSEAEGEFAHRSLGTSSLGGTQPLLDNILRNLT